MQTFENKTTELVTVTYEDEKIITTPTHPFYVPQKGWTDAINLRAGDILVTCNGEYVVVEKIQHEILEAPITVYNFEVEDYHTYYVSANADSTDASVLVHNKCDFKHYEPDELADFLGTSVDDLHRNIKPKIMTEMRNEFTKKQLTYLGKNPDILLRKSDGAIKLASRITKGVSYQITKKIWEIIS